MMLNRDYDSIVVGRNYLSFIISLFLVKENKSVLLVDDERVKFGDNWYKSISDIEINFLSLLGETHNITPLNEISKFLKEKPYFLKLDDRILLLGRTPYENFKELIRKIPECFSEECLKLFDEQNESDFNRMSKIFFNSVSENCFKLRRSQDFDESIIDRSLNNFYKVLFKDFITHFYNSKSSKIPLNMKQLMFTMQGKFQSLFSDSFSKFEMKYLLIQLLSTRYELNEKSLNTQLEKSLLKNNGHIKKTTIQYWQFYQKRLTSILLSSYEGVVHPKKTFYVGNFHADTPFFYENKFRLFTDLIIDFKYPTDIFKSYVGRSVVFNYSKRVGADYPFWEASFIAEDKVSFRYLYPKHSGAKPEFYLNQGKSDIFHSLKGIFPDFDEKLVHDSIELRKGNDLWTEAFNSGGSAFNQLLKEKELQIFNAQDREEVKDLDYWGPMNVQPLGLLSYLMDVKSNYL